MFILPQNIKNFAEIARPLHTLTEKHCTFGWTKECNEAFEKLQMTLIPAPILCYPDMTKQFILYTDASGFGIGAVLSQIHEGKEVVVAYYSKSLSKAQRQYCVTRQELLALILSIKHFHHYLYGTHFKVRTDHGALTWLLRFKNPEGQMARWLETLNTYNFEIRHRPGRQHGNADGLSRRQCFPCSYCSKQDQKEIDNSDESSVEYLRMAKVQDPQETSCSNKTDSVLWSEHKTNQEMFEAQKCDNVLFNLYRLKSDNNNRPEWAGVALQDVKLKKYWSQWDRIVLINNGLYRKWINATTEESYLQFLVPEIWKENTMKMLHDDIQVGHFGHTQNCSQSTK
ncbi:Retrovirus-related Pol polyprotein from transposon 412 [Mytilus coruscus]|uniref:Retrovirus-related Pol polyprotein from transposon 412 n=1 Tax=Mytilus coruscus TaxID=42192 RepID=A0A6J7ZYT7_MYTCO|nr:Retrovirus-related Pol polyprotein from transposon 412 [Mytilus coruscus]